MSGKDTVLPNASPQVHRCYRSLNRPLTICGVERRLFFAATLVAAAMFNFFGSLLGGLLMFLTLYLFGRWATRTDPEILRVLLNSAKFRSHYDPLKRHLNGERRQP